LRARPGIRSSRNRPGRAGYGTITQVYHLFQLAATEGMSERLRKAFDTVLIASIGPVCSEALREHGLASDFEPEHPKMGYLVAARGLT